MQPRKFRFSPGWATNAAGVTYKMLCSRTVTFRGVDAIWKCWGRWIAKFSFGWLSNIKFGHLTGELGRPGHAGPKCNLFFMLAGG
jgi:hypothetical protein